MDLRKQVAGLLAACPLVMHPAGCENPLTCPLFQIRHLSTRARKCWLASLNQVDLQYLLDYHRVCFPCGMEKLRKTAVPAAELFKVCLKF
jgi:hypothetical protein